MDRSPAYWAFRAFRNFDGRGGRFLDRSASVLGAAPLASLFASRDDEGGRVVAVLLNEDPTSPLRAEIDVATCGTPSAARTFSYSGDAAGFAPGPEARVVGATLDVVAESYSITTIELTFQRDKG
jgi:hypothetical protein